MYKNTYAFIEYNQISTATGTNYSDAYNTYMLILRYVLVACKGVHILVVICGCFVVSFMI